MKKKVVSFCHPYTIVEIQRQIQARRTAWQHDRNMQNARISRFEKRINELETE